VKSHCTFAKHKLAKTNTLVDFQEQVKHESSKQSGTENITANASLSCHMPPMLKLLIKFHEENRSSLQDHQCINYYSSKVALLGPNP
jgi:hypothetical protein